MKIRIHCFIIYLVIIMNNFDDNSLERSRRLYIIEAALEYLIAILVSGSFFTTLTKDLGFSDSTVGILSSIISLGCLFQLFSIALRPKRVKKIVVMLSLTNQILFSALYILPLLNIGNSFKRYSFVFLIILAYFIYYIVHPKKINWLMSLVDDHHRGIFTANKEIISLIAGMTFSFLMGLVVDYFIAINNLKIAFIVSAAVMLVITLLHTLTMIFTVEKEESTAPKKSVIKSVRETLKDKNIIKVIIIFIIYYIASNSSLPFFATYQLGELNFSVTLITVLGIVSSVARILASKFWGKYADRKSFAVMIEKCLIIFGVSLLCVVFAVPSNGKIMFTLYYILYGIAMGGVNSALINMIFDYVPHEKRADSLAVSQALSGVTGFLTTLAVSPIVDYIQNNGNKILGIQIYAQQAVTALGVIFTVIAILYVRFFLINKNVKSDV